MANLTQKIAKDVNEVILLFGDIGGVLLSEDVLSQDIRSTIYSQVISKEQLQQKVDFCELLARPRDYNCLDFVETRFNYTRQFSPHFLESFTFRSLKEEDELIDALQLIKQCNDENKRKIPTSVPTSFISPSWMEQMKKEDGTLDKHYYELCILTSLKDALRSGDIWVEGSRRYTDIKNYLFDDDHWEANKEKYYEQLNLPQDPRKFLSNLEQFFLELSTQVDDNFPTNPWAEIVDGELKVKRVEVVEIPDEVEQVKKLITSALPRVKLPDLLIEVDQWTHFTRHFTYFSGQESRTKDLQKCLFANFIGQGCNIGLVNMADSTPDITYRQLFHVSQWYLRDDTLRKAMAEIINFQHRLPLASVWGDGTRSSSDGMRISVPVNIFGAEFHPKYFGQYGRGVTLYSFLSDQFTEYYLKIILCNLREAAFVLDGLLNNETDLNPQEHFTDTHGYTENVFALASLLGFKFCPRLKDFTEQRMYKLKKEQIYSQIEPLFRDWKTNRVRSINTSLIIEQWDNIVRLVASLKNRIVSASLLLTKMGSYSRASRLLRAIVEVGRIFKTLFMLEYLDNP
ncbi:MAG: Tn3 family transposase [bacterium]